MKSRLLILILIVSAGLTAQTGNSRPVSTVFAELTKSLESRNAAAGQELVLRTISDLVVNGEVIIPRGSRLLGHVIRAAVKGKGEEQSVLEVVIDKAIRNDNVEISLQAIIAAVAAPQNRDLSADPTAGMMRSNEPKMVGARPSAAANSGELSASSKAASTAAVATAELKGRMDEPVLLNQDSQGALGYEGLSLSWRLDSPPPGTVFSSKGKNVKLEAGTQMLLRMATPHLPR